MNLLLNSQFLIMEHSLDNTSDNEGLAEKFPLFGKNFKFIQEIENQSFFQRIYLLNSF